MSAMHLVGGLLPGEKRVERQIREDIPRHPILTPMAGSESQQTGLSAPHAAKLKLLMFSGKAFQASPHLQIEQAFVRGLSHKKLSVEEKAGIAEMLGRAQSINALPHLLKLLDAKEDVVVRTSSATALGAIGNATDTDSYTRTRLTSELLPVYVQRKNAFIERLEKPAEKSYEKRLQEEQVRRKLTDELKALITAVSDLNTAEGRKVLHREYEESLMMTEQILGAVRAMSHIVRLAEDAVHKRLVKQYQKPIKQILAEIPRSELEKLAKDVVIQMPNGREVNLQGARKLIRQLQAQQLFASQWSVGLMDALARRPQREHAAVLKLGLDSMHPKIKAKALRVLADRNGVNYSSDIAPNLLASDKTLRQAALYALTLSTDLAAKQKVVDLLTPKAFFDVSGAPVTSNSFRQYVDFLKQLAKRGDETIHAIAGRVVNADFDVETRQIALLVLGMMTQEPILGSVSQPVIARAREVIRQMAINPPAGSPEERDALAVMATQLWVMQNDPDAIASAIVLAGDEFRSVTPDDQTDLLSAVVDMLELDARKAGQVQLSRAVFSVLKRSDHSLLEEAVQREIEDQFSAERLKQPVQTVDANPLMRDGNGLRINQGLIENLQPSLKPLRPHLEQLLNGKNPVMTQMLISRVIGLLKDKLLLDPLIDKVRDPLKGQMDWNAERSYQRNPSIDGANIRLNALLALGRIGDAKALDVMLDAVDDPILRPYVLEPLGRLAKSTNAQNDVKALENVRDKLVRVIESPDTGRMMRAIRLRAADALFQFDGGAESIKNFAKRTSDPNFKRQALSVLVSNNYALDPSHPDHPLVRALTVPELNVEMIHNGGITGKGVDMSVIDGGYVDQNNHEAFQDRVKLPANAEHSEDEHPTMVSSTAAANGKLKGVAPSAIIYSDQWPDFDAADPMAVYKKIIEGKLRGENNVRVINNSWGFNNQNIVVFKEIRDILKQFKTVVDLAERAGIQIVFAAGNSGEEPGLPKLGTLSLFGVDIEKLTAEDQKTLDYILDKVILVGAVNTQGSSDIRQHRVAEFSSVGDSLNNKLAPAVVAPGVDMMTYSWGEKNGNKPKELVNGTSFASPFVSGVVALMMEANPKLTPVQVRDILKKTAVKLPNVPVTLQGAGEVDPQAVVRLAQESAKRKAK